MCLNHKTVFEHISKLNLKVYNKETLAQSRTGNFFFPFLSYFLINYSLIFCGRVGKKQIMVMFFFGGDA